MVPRRSNDRSRRGACGVPPVRIGLWKMRGSGGLRPPCSTSPWLCRLASEGLRGDLIALCPRREFAAQLGPQRLLRHLPVEGSPFPQLCIVHVSPRLMIPVGRDVGAQRQTAMRQFCRWGAADAWRRCARRWSRPRAILVCCWILERAKGFEPSTPTLARLCSTPELRPRPDAAARRGLAAARRASYKAAPRLQGHLGTDGH
jgi:hypothetical protein